MMRVFTNVIAAEAMALTTMPESNTLMLRE
jgi:hypothetical protein